MSENNQGPNFSTRPVIRVDLKALKNNYNAIKSMVGPKTNVSAAVKADAYGLGAEKISKSLYGAGCRIFFVATAGEGKIVRAAIGDRATIYVLNGPAPRDLTLFFGSQLRPVINSLTQARIWEDAIAGVRQPPYCAIHLDTGINRLGFTQEGAERLSKNKALQDKLHIELIMSHLACASDKSSPYNKEQLAAFRARAARFPVKPLSLANTAGIYLGRDYHFQLVRPGIGLYGGFATTDPAQEKVEPVVSLMAPVLQLKTLQSGESLGYNSTFTAQRETQVAIVGAGYADGIPVASSSNQGSGLSHATMSKKRLPVIGRVSMDLTALDVTALTKRPRIGDWAEFFGANLDADADEASTINYELLVRLGTRARREYR